MKERMTLNQYKEKVKFFWKHFEKKMLVDADDNEIYRVFNVCRPDMEGRIGLYGSLFRKMDSIRELISRADENNISDYDDDIDEYLEEISYWVIEKYRLFGDEYMKLFSLMQVNKYGYLEVEFNCDFDEFATDSEKEVYKEWSDIFELQFKGVDLALPYKPGEILKLDNRPLSNEAEYIILHKNQLVFKRDSWGDLSYGSLLMGGKENGYVDFIPCHITTVPYCPDPVLNKLSTIIREGNEDKIQSIISRLFEKENILESSRTAKAIEQEILTGKANTKEEFKERITLGEYKELREKAGLTFMSLFAQTPQNDELYFVKSHISKSNIVNKSYKQEIFHDFDKMIEFIKEESPHLYTDWNNSESYENTVWWSVQKRKLINDTYKTTMYCAFDSSGNVLEFLAGEAFYDGYHSDDRYAELYKQLLIVNYSDEYGTVKLPEIEFPFEVGDILFANKRPIGEAKEYVYLGEHKREYSGVYYLCLARSTFKENNKYQVTTLKELGDLVIDGQPYFHLLEKRDHAEDVYMNKASIKIKKDREIAKKIIEIGEHNTFGSPDEIEKYFDEIQV